MFINVKTVGFFFSHKRKQICKKQNKCTLEIYCECILLIIIISIIIIIQRVYDDFIFGVNKQYLKLMAFLVIDGKWRVSCNDLPTVSTATRLSYSQWVHYKIIDKKVIYKYYFEEKNNFS